MTTTGLILSIVAIVLTLAAVGTIAMWMDDVHTHVNELERKVKQLEEIVKYYSDSRR